MGVSQSSDQERTLRSKLLSGRTLQRLSRATLRTDYPADGSCENDRYRRNLPLVAPWFRWKTSWFEDPRLIVITGSRPAGPSPQGHPVALAYVPVPLMILLRKSPCAGP